MSLRIFIIAGEASGDMYGGLLAEELRAHRPDVHISGWGGGQMIAAGVEILRHISSLSFMGLTEVLRRAISIRSLFRECRLTISQGNFDAIIFIDFPGFNLRMAKWVKQYHPHMHTIQYISPKIWAWKEGRVRIIKRYIDTLICIFPFEIDLYRRYGITAYYCGHPLLAHLDRINVQSRQSEEASPRHLDVALMPGSRKQEIDRILPIMLQLSQYYPEHDFTIGGMSLFGEDYYQSIIDQAGVLNIKISMDDNYSLLAQSDVAINTSGTVTLETALLNIPQIVVYKAKQLSYVIGKSLLRIEYISLPNILLDKRVVPELIQANCQAEMIKQSMDHIIKNPTIQLAGYQEIREILQSNQREMNVAILICNRIGLK